MTLGLRIAVVDDEASVRKALKRLLQSVGHSVETYDTGGAFLQSLSQNTPDCVILDLHLPGITGFDVLNSLNEGTWKLVVVVITGDDQPGVRQRALALGASAYLPKPLDEKVLLAALTSPRINSEKKE
jgi:FixJ family two-component response regulator